MGKHEIYSKMKDVVEPMPSLEQVLREPSSMEITLEEFHRNRKKLSQRLES